MSTLSIVHQHFPIVIPTRDVEVDYADLQNTSGHAEQRMFYSPVSYPAPPGASSLQTDPPHRAAVIESAAHVEAARDLQ
jgi:hypothetical protein